MLKVKEVALEHYDEAKKLVLQKQEVSAVFLEKHLKIGYNAASHIVRLLERNKVISPDKGLKTREILLTEDGLPKPTPQ